MELSLVIPAFNEAEVIQETLRHYCKMLGSLKMDYEILVGDDGSTDKTIKIVKDCIRTSNRIKLISVRKNCGKGKILTKCFGKASGDICGYIDADLFVRKKMLAATLGKFKENDAVVGIKRNSNLKNYPFLRKLLSLSYNNIANFILGTSVSDYQTGFKFFKRDCLMSVLKSIKTEGWSWDTEVIYKLCKKGFKIGEIPLMLERDYQRKSRIRVVEDTFRMLIELFVMVQR